jgi:hypothetical protein
MGLPHVLMGLLQTLDMPVIPCGFVLTPRLRRTERSLPESHSRGLQANGGEAGHDSRWFAGLWGPVASLVRISVSASRHSIDESLSFDSVLLSRGIALGARCVPGPAARPNTG